MCSDRFFTLVFTAELFLLTARLLSYSLLQYVLPSPPPHTHMVLAVTMKVNEFHHIVRGGESNSAQGK